MLCRDYDPNASAHEGLLLFVKTNSFYQNVFSIQNIEQNLIIAQDMI